MKTIFLIDGSSMLSTQFYGNLPASYKFAKNENDKLIALERDTLKTSNGIYTNAVFGMTKTILKLMSDYQPEYLAVCWDISRETFRRILYPGYKAHRKDTPKQLSSQFQLMQKVLEQMKIPQFKKENYEADDLLGTISKKFSENHKVIILTKDRDALQLINFNTTVWLNTKQSKDLLLQIADLDNEFKHAPMHYFPFSIDAFRVIYGLEPIQLIDLKGLTGDKSDGIPGIDKMGDKTAIPILQRYETIENFYSEIEPLDVKQAKKILMSKNIKRVNPEKMILNKGIVLLSKELAKIEQNVPGFEGLSLDELKQNYNISDSQTIFKELEFNSLLH